MKKENEDVAVNTQNPSVSQKPVKAMKGKKPKVVDKVQLPVLVEFTHTTSAIFLVFVGLMMIITSFLTGASLLNLVLRTSVALLLIGMLLLMITSQISSGLLQASLAEQDEHRKSQIKEHETPETSLASENTDVVEA